MPAQSQSQRALIFSRRDRYGSEESTPNKWKWIWDEGWENRGKLPEKKKKKNKKKKNESIVTSEPFSRARMVPGSTDTMW